MKKNLKRFFAELMPGDGLRVDVIVGSQPITARMSVLRRSGDRSEFIHLAYGLENGWGSRPMPWGPFRWDDEKGVLVDREGDIPPWFTLGELQVDRDAAKEATERYVRVPREEHVRVKVDEMALNRIFKSTFMEDIFGIAVNEEAGGFDTQLVLVLELIGVQIDSKQLSLLLIFLAAHKSIQEAKDAVGRMSCLVDCA